MRTKRFLSLLLAIAMLAGLTISAWATEPMSKVYFLEDYNDFEDYAAWYATTNKVTGSLATNLANFDTFKATGSKVFTDNAAYSTPGSTEMDLTVNSDGQNQLFITTAYSNAGHTAFFPATEWNAVENTDETYVFSATLEQSGDVAGKHNLDLFSLIGNKGTSAEPSYGSGAMLSNYGGTFRHTGSTNYNGVTVGFVAETTTDVAYAVTYNTTKGVLTKTTVQDGTVKQNAVEDATIKGFKTVGALGMNTSSSAGLGIADLKLYTLKNTEGAFNVARTVTGVIPTSTTSLKVKFSQPVIAATYDKTAVTMSKDGEALTYGVDFILSDVTEVVENVGGEIYSEATISFLTDLEPEAEYTVTFPGTIKNTIAKELEGYNTITFNTPVPDIKVESFGIVTGFGSDAEATAESFVANGTLQGAAIALKNTTSADKNVSVIYAVYGTSGQLTDVVYANDVIKASSVGEVNAGVKLSETGTVKAFIWDGLNSLKPHTDATVKTIAAE